jgi:hypothetical protein
MLSLFVLSAGFTIVLKHRAPLARGRGPIFLPQFFFTMDFCLCGAILNLKVFCFGAIQDIMIEFIVYGSVPGLLGLRIPPSGPK